MIEFVYDNKHLILKYSLEDNIDWIKKKISEESFVRIKSTYIFEEKDIILMDEKNLTVSFKLGTIDGNYYKISKKKLNSKMNIFFHKSIKLKFDYFNYSIGSYEGVSVFKVISEVLKKPTDLYIGGEQANISLEDFENLIKSFPNAYEKKLYLKSRIYQSIENYFENTVNFKEKLENYRDKHNNTIINGDINKLNKYELEKYNTILEKLKYMYNNEDKYSEKQWQKEIAEIILLIFPKYIDFVEKVRISIQDSNKRYEEFDMLLITASGNVDILEIKKPQNTNIISNGTDRDNYYSTNFLSKTVMQLEKYIYHLNSLGYGVNLKLEKNPKFKNIVDIVSIKVMNPKGIAILGKEKDLNVNQKRDLEIIKKMYANMVEIITYDDLIRRVENTINIIKKRGVNDEIKV